MHGHDARSTERQKRILNMYCLDKWAALNCFCGEIQGTAFMKAVINVIVQ